MYYSVVLLGNVGLPCHNQAWCVLLLLLGHVHLHRMLLLLLPLQLRLHMA